MELWDSEVSSNYNVTRACQYYTMIPSSGLRYVWVSMLHDTYVPPPMSSHANMPDLDCYMLVPFSGRKKVGSKTKPNCYFSQYIHVKQPNASQDTSLSFTSYSIVNGVPQQRETRNTPDKVVAPLTTNKYGKGQHFMNQHCCVFSSLSTSFFWESENKHVKYVV